MGMMRSGGITRLGIALALTLPVWGCQTGLQEAYQFPMTWPGSRPLGEDAPTVSVEPLRLDIEPTEALAEGEGGLPTAAVLSALLVKHLHVNGVNAILERPEGSTAEYTLSCTIPTLGYGEDSDYPRERFYRAELTCALRDEQTRDVVWERSLTQRYEQTMLLNLLTKLPPRPYRHERVLFRECIMPLWDAMASSVGSVLVSRQEISQIRDRSQQIVQDDTSISP